MTGWALPAMVMDPLSLFPSTLTRLVETDGCVSTDGVRSSKSSESQRQGTADFTQRTLVTSAYIVCYCHVCCHITL